MRSLPKKYGGWAIVTGASSGIGKSFAHQLARAGVNVVLVSRSEHVLQEVSNELNEKFGVQTRILALDLTESTAGQTLQSEFTDKSLLDPLQRANRSRVASNRPAAGRQLTEV